MATVRPNLARRPFVDSRPANLAAAVLLVAAVVLTWISVSTVRSYLVGSRASREAIGSLRAEIGKLEAERRVTEQKLGRFDLAGLRAGAEEANDLARLRAFSWSRFLTRLEKTLPNDVRVVSVTLARQARPSREGAGAAPVETDGYNVGLSLVTREPDSLPGLIRAFYASPWFDAPVPVSEAGGEKGTTEGRSVTINVVYRDREAKR